MAQVKITVRPNGPFRVEAPEGSIELVDVNGTPYDLTGKTAFSSVPLWRFGEQAFLRRNSQQDRFPGCGTGSEEGRSGFLTAEALVGDSRDRELGMHRSITRRDFINGVAVAAGAAMMPRSMPGSNPPPSGQSPAYYPPAPHRAARQPSRDRSTSLTVFATAPSGIRGKPEDTGETYDLVIVGGGISGLSAAYFYRNATGNGARILILENHDDFGGHAKRNEFQAGKKTLIGYGGTYSIESPEPYSAVAKELDRGTWDRRQVVS